MYINSVCLCVCVCCINSACLCVCHINSVCVTVCGPLGLIHRGRAMEVVTCKKL